MSEDGFLSRWSRRKLQLEAEKAEQAARLRAAAEAEAPASSAAGPEVASAAETPAAADAPRSVSEADAEKMTDAEILERLNLPSPDSIADTDQARAFLHAGVPARLQRLAMRRMWAVTPDSQLACFDGLRDYAEDYTDAALGAGSVRTSYVVGKGLRAHVEALARQAEAKAEAERAAALEAAEGGADPQTEAADEATADAGMGGGAMGAAAEVGGAPSEAAATSVAAARSHVRPPDSGRSDALQQEKSRPPVAPSEQNTNPDEIALGQLAADAATQKQYGAAAKPAKPRRMVFRFDES